MSKTGPAPHESAAPANDEAIDPAVARGERRLRMLEELAEIGMVLARSLTAAAAAGPEEAPAGEAAQAPVRDPAGAFARLSRAIRLTLAMEIETDRNLRYLQTDLVRAREEERAKAPARASKARDERKSHATALVIEAAQAECETLEDFENLREALDERLARDAAYCRIGERPLREIVERLCKDLELNPDWSRWDGEGWSQEGPPIRPKFSVFRNPSAISIRKRRAADRADGPPGRPPSGADLAGHALE